VSRSASAGTVIESEIDPPGRSRHCWLQAWRSYLRQYRLEGRLLVAGGLVLALASAVLVARGALTWPLALALAQLAGALLVADALGRVVAGTVLDYLFERRVARLSPVALRLHALATGDLEAAEAQSRDILEQVFPANPSGDVCRDGQSRRRGQRGGMRR
jgi:hypothetical protein